MKKKLVALLTAIAISTMPVYAAIPDIVGLTMDELVELRAAVNDAIFENGGAVEIMAGIYVVGRDIAAGSYKLSTIDDGSCVFYVFEGQEKFDEYKEVTKEHSETSREAESVAKQAGAVYSKYPSGMNLIDGDVVYIRDNMMIEKATMPFAP